MSEVEPPPPGTEDHVLPMPSTITVVEPVPSVTDTATSSASLLEDAPEHEEGEIEDDEDDDGMQYENISSDEEFIIRERLLQLQAMDTEISLRKKIAGRNGGAAARHNGMIKEFVFDGYCGRFVANCGHFFYFVISAPFNENR